MDMGARGQDCEGSISESLTGIWLLVDAGVEVRNAPVPAFPTVPLADERLALCACAG